MRNIKKAILAFAIFGFFGGCEAANVVVNEDTQKSAKAIRQINIDQGLSIYDNRMSENDPNAQYYTIDVRANGPREVLDNNTYRRHHLVKQFSYRKEYASIIEKFMKTTFEKDENLNEDKFCKSLLQMFLVDDDIEDMYGLTVKEAAVVDNIRRIYYWHVEKHFFDVSGRYTNGRVHTRVKFPGKDSGSSGYTIKIGEMSMPLSHYEKMRDVTRHIIGNAHFEFNADRQISIDEGYQWLDRFVYNDFWNGAKICEHEVNDGKIGKVVNEYDFKRKFFNLSFFFHLVNSPLIGELTISKMRTNENRDGIFGSFFVEI